MIAARNPLAYDKKTGLYQKVNKPIDVLPKNPLVYDKVTGLYQKANRPLKRTYASFLESTPCESVDVIPTKKTCMSCVPHQMTEICCNNLDIKNFENIIPSPTVRYIIGQKFDYIKKF
jgi:hypothetical protein